MKDNNNAIITPVDPPICINAQGPLSGLDFVVKDLFDVVGLPTFAGNPEYGQYRGMPVTNAAAADILLKAGGRLVGKTHLHELAYGITGINPHFGTPVNPLDPRRIPGGSSSGSAVAVASGLVPFALGSDTAGSIRVPAGFCGIWSLRPTFDRIPVAGSVPLSPSMDTVGIFASNMETLERVAKVMLDSYDSASFGDWTVKRALIPDDTSGWDPDLVRAFQAVIEATQDMGLKLETFPGAILHESLDAQRVVQFAEILAVHEEWMNTCNPRLGEDVALHLETASKLSVAQIGRAVSKKAGFVARFTKMLGNDGMFLLPVAAGPAPLLSDLANLQNSLGFRMQTLALNTIASISGLPATTIPVKIPNSLSVGIQLVGLHDTDISLISMAGRMAERMGL